MSLQLLFTEIPDWREMSDETILDLLTAPQMIPKPESMISIAHIQGLYGVPVGEAIYQALVASGATGTAARFAATGLDSTNPQWQEYADKIAEAVPSLAPVHDAIKFIGFDRRSLWARQSDEELTLEMIKEARNDLESQSEKDVLRARLGESHTAAHLAIEAGEDEDGVKNAILRSWDGE